MVNLIKDLPIKQKLIFTVMSTTVFGLLLAGIAFIVLERKASMNAITQQITTLGRIIADRSTAAIIFDDRKSAEEILSALKQEPSILTACIFDEINSLFASYTTGNGNKCPVKNEGLESLLKDGLLYTSYPIQLEFESIGEVHLVASLQSVNEQTYSFIATMIIVILVVAIVIYPVVSRQQKMISQPIINLANVARKISDTPDYSLRVDSQSADEIGYLYQAFNNMLDQIHEREVERDNAEQALVERSAQVSLLMEATAEAIYGIDLQGICTFANPSCLRHLNYQHLDEILGEKLQTLIHHRYTNEKSQFENHLFNSIKQGRATHSDDEFVWRKDGSFFPVEYWSHPIYEKGKLTGAVVTFIDITDRKQAEAEIHRHRENLEELVEDRTKELKLSNQELESFSYSVSHDLRGPLRVVDGFTQALYEDYNNLFDETASDYIHRIRQSAQRMDTLIDDLLMLSRINRHQISTEEVNLSSLAHTVLQQLKEEDPDRVVDIRIQDNLKVMGDSHLLEIMMQNLIGNAWKYTSRNNLSAIEFYANVREDGFVYTVADNGAGFDMRYVNKIFGEFQRLHSDDEFKGTGIGLATVKRIINRHRGSIWAEGEVGKGAKFHFMLTQT